MADVNIKPITRLLVANRGEIARRIFRTAKEMGLVTIAVYAEGDAKAPFVREADLSVALKGYTPAETYLDVQRVIDACTLTGADAVHPGYGFLSENVNFAKAVIDVGLTWIGPPVSAIDRMGDKLAAKALMIEAGVPTLQARELRANDDISAAAQDIGYPILVKASAGGGGRGMRVVQAESELAAAVDSARREAKASFGDDTVFLERWLTSSKHIEIQILGDNHGNLVHFFERECSIQRRHQKIIEEAPSPAVSTELRSKMGEAALAAAQKIGYASAGTVEFLVDGQNFWFLEVNTRLQVEHPVTELITGMDLVREQIRLAEGDSLGYGQDDLAIHGHAIEARVYAEDPSRDFLPAPGTIKIWEPSSLARVDSGVESGSVVSMDFDPMIAKVITHAPTRRAAAIKLARALETTRIHGITSNRDFLAATLKTPEFLAGDTTTDFIERVDPPRIRAVNADELAGAAIAITLVAQHQRRRSANVLTRIPSGWQNSHMPPQRVQYSYGDSEISVEYRSQRDGSFNFVVDGTESTVLIYEIGHDSIDTLINQRRMQFSITSNGDKWFIHGPNGDVELTELPRFHIPTVAELRGGLTAPMPGKILATEVDVGDAVEAGQLLVILEAMKMEHQINAPTDGAVRKVNVQVGDQVEKDFVLIELDSEA